MDGIHSLLTARSSSDPNNSIFVSFHEYCSCLTRPAMIQGKKKHRADCARRRPLNRKPKHLSVGRPIAIKVIWSTWPNGVLASSEKMTQAAQAVHNTSCSMHGLAFGRSWLEPSGATHIRIHKYFSFVIHPMQHKYGNASWLEVRVVSLRNFEVGVRWKIPTVGQEQGST